MNETHKEEVKGEVFKQFRLKAIKAPSMVLEQLPLIKIVRGRVYISRSGLQCLKCRNLNSVNLIEQGSREGRTKFFPNLNDHLSESLQSVTEPRFQFRRSKIKRQD